MDFKNFFHVLNPSSHQKENVRHFIEKNPELRSAWVERTSHPTHLETILNWTLVEGIQNVALWGGDGTYNRVIQFYYEQKVLDKVILMLIPAGTCNDFYRKNFKSEGRERSDLYDLGVLEFGSQKRIFLNNAGFGRTPSAIKKKKSHPILDVLSLTNKHITVEWNRQSVSLDVLLAVVCNSPFFNCGLHFQSIADPQDGKLNAYFEQTHSKIALLWKLMRGHHGQPLMDSHTTIVNSDRIRVSSDTLVYPQVDGELVTSEGIKKMMFTLESKVVRLCLAERPK